MEMYSSLEEALDKSKRADCRADFSPSAFPDKKMKTAPLLFLRSADIFMISIQKTDRLFRGFSRAALPAFSRQPQGNAEQIAARILPADFPPDFVSKT